MNDPEAPCGLPECPVVRPATIDRRLLRVIVLPGGTDRFRVARLEHMNAVFTPEGHGDGRFSPLAGCAHTYVAEQRSAAILESVLHEASGPNPRIYAAQLARFGIVRVRFSAPVRLIDLRDEALTALGLSRPQLTDSGPRHYACTRAVAERLSGAKGSDGFVWTSRQGSLHAARNPDGLASEVLRHASLDVAVIHRPGHEGRITILDTEPLADGGVPTRFVTEVANLLRIAIL